MSTVVLVRHGRTTANASGVLAGWSEGVGLDDTGRAQAVATGARLAGVPLAAAVVSPLQRCQETADALLAGREVPRRDDARLGECGYGDWTGKELKVLAKDPLWKVVQDHPSGMRFPGGESLLEVQTRAVTAVRETGAALPDDAVWLAVSHGDVIKAVLADALGMHLDAFQRIVVDPCSVSVVRYTSTRPFVLRMNDAGPDLSWLAPPARKRRSRRSAASSADAVVGGGSGPA
ncbi:putative phosphomutase (TIGR03848 family) [Motilibacter peucedani]|uniref:Putative phosphomutase (TIGR03848 family) n=1 Tax=Motilibacter peucedani TaxID=598650 RepID=A0A420XJL7_9ACTN|nr:histidine phosphatase family protein [Motilibacter peucedani]RKS67941.1 putative phosphomutase (TIGR03848 family) [Motilibacter peucedani]